MTTKEKAVAWLLHRDIAAKEETFTPIIGTSNVYVHLNENITVELSTNEVDYRAELWDDMQETNEEEGV